MSDKVKSEKKPLNAGTVKSTSGLSDNGKGKVSGK